MCVDPDWMPYERIDEQGKHVGIAADFMSEFQKRIPVPIELVLTESWKESLEAAKSRQCDILSLLNESPQRREFLNFTDPYLTDSVVIVARNDVFYLDGLASLSGRKLGIVEGYVYEEKIRKQYPEIIIIPVKSIEDALRKVSDGKIYATLDALFIITSNIQELGLSNLKIAGQAGLDNVFRIGVRKDDPILLSVFDKVIKNLDDTSRNAILRSWYTIKFQHGTDWRIVWQVTGIAIIILCLLGYRILLTRRFNHKLAEANKLLLNKNQELRRAEENLRESEERYRIIVEDQTDYVSRFLPDKTLTFVNKSLSKMTNMKKEDLIGRKFSDWMSEDNYKSLNTTLEQITPENPSYAHEQKLTLPDGRTVWQHWINCGSFDKDGNILEYQGVGRDITHMKKMEEEKLIFESQRSQAKKNEAIGTLAGGIAHDFNNILNSIFGQIQLLKNTTPETDKRYDQIEGISIASIRARDLVKQILVFGRQGEQNQQPVLLQPIIEETLQLLDQQKNESINVQQKINMGCGAIQADPTQIRQVCTNLITNAFQSMKQDGGLLEVKLAETEVGEERKVHPNLKAGRYVRFTISDSGPGIRQEVLEKIFDPYFTTRTFGEGTGLGLAIADGIVKSHGGAIIVDSMPGHGTVFDVFFPLSKDQTKLVSVEQHKKTPQSAKHILFVDDEPINVQTWKMALEMEGFKVTGYSDSLEALEAFRESPETYDIIITDQRMPNLTGIELAEEVRQTRRDIPILLSTGWSDSISKRKVKDMGINEVIAKPHEMENLLNAIGSAFNPKEL